MCRRATIVTCLAVIGALAGAGTGWAHTLTIERGHKASLKGAQEQCENDAPSCRTYSADNCRRPPRSGHAGNWRRHRVQCDITLAGTDGVGPWQCHWVDEWSIRRDENRLRWSSIVYHQTYDGCPYDDPAAFRPVGA